MILECYLLRSSQSPKFRTNEISNFICFFQLSYIIARRGRKEIKQRWNIEDNTTQNKIKISNTKYTEEKFNENKIEKIVKMLDPTRKEWSHQK